MVQLSFSQALSGARCKIDCVAGKLQERSETDGGGWNQVVMGVGPNWILDKF